MTNYGDGTVTPITIATNTPGTPITVGTSPFAIAITPNGQTAYVTNFGGGTVTPITIASNTPGTPIAVGTNPRGIAVTPDQAPTALFAVTPAAPGSASSFDGSASGAPVGSITNYAWTFGDGNSSPTNSTPTTTHTYTSAGPFTASLTVTDAAGTYYRQVFTGQTVSNNGAGLRRGVPIFHPSSRRDRHHPECRPPRRGYHGDGDGLGLCLHGRRAH